MGQRPLIWSTPVRILLVEDDQDLVDVTAYALRREGFDVSIALNADQALRSWQDNHPELIVLDIGLPDRSGFDVCREIRKTDTIPVVFLSALGSEEDIVQGFQCGADDYVTKPFSPRQLAWRIRAVGRRAAQHDVAPRQRIVRAADLYLDLETHEVRRGDRQVHLTPIEFRLLYLLASNPGRVMSANRLIEFAWGYDQGDGALLKTHLSHIRKKLTLPRSGAGSISAIVGVGYRFQDS